MRNVDLKARVRYNKGIPGVEPDQGEKALDEESFVLDASNAKDSYFFFI